MGDNPFVAITDKLKRLSVEHAERIKLNKEKVKKESDYWKEYQEDAKMFNSIVTQFPNYKAFLEKTRDELQKTLDFILTNDFKDFSYGKMTAKASILSAQKQLLDYLINRPAEVLNILKEYNRNK